MLNRNSSLDHLCCPPVTKQSPSDVRKAEFACHGLNLLTHDLLVADRASLACMWKHPVVVTRFHPLRQLEEAFHICLRKLDRAVGAVILRLVELASVHGAFDPQLPFLHIKV